MKKNSGLIAAFSLMLACSSGYAQNKSDSLLKEFATPPNSAKPRVWWHWMNGNISKDGIAKDLLWMNRIGIGGFMNFDAAMTTPQVLRLKLRQNLSVQFQMTWSSSTAQMQVAIN